LKPIYLTLFAFVSINAAYKKTLIQKIMKTRSSHIHHLRRKKEVDYSNYHFAMALYDIYKKESRKEARLPAHDFRNRVSQKESGTDGLKQKLGRFVLAIIKAITGSVFFRNEKRAIIDQQTA
jgi:hypothetical protein